MKDHRTASRHTSLLLTFAILTGLALAAGATAVDSDDGPCFSPHIAIYTVPGPDQFSAPPRAAFHTQPYIYGALNASTAYDSEVADDVPGEYEGETIGSVTLYVAEWMGTVWVPPDGITLSFYLSACPPSLGPDLVYFFPWASIPAEFVYNGPPGNMFVYAAELVLPSPLTIPEVLSIGATVNMHWGIAAPFCGFCFSQPTVFGCGEMYWDDELDGVPRWTAVSGPLGSPADLAYILNSPETGIDDEQQQTTWGRMKASYR